MSGDMKPCIAIVDLCPFLKDEEEKISNSNKFKGDEIVKSQLKAALELHEAFQDTGFAIVVNHGIQKETSDILRAHSLKYFSLNIDKKSLLADGKSIKEVSTNGENPIQPHYQYMTESVAQLLGDFTQPRDLVESLTYRGNYQQDYLDGTLEFPNEPKGFSDAIMNFEAACHRTRQILTKCAEMAFDLPLDFLANQCSVKDESLRLAHYPEVANPSKQLRFGAHVDTYGLTMLMLDPEHPEGLQVLVKTPNGEEWVDVPYIENSIVINVGALLSRWTGGLWKAAVHRVKFHPGRRMSIVSGALKPRNDIVMQTLCPKDVLKNQIMYPPILVEDFVKERVKLHYPQYLEDKNEGQKDPEFIQTLQNEIKGYHI